MPSLISGENQAPLIIWLIHPYSEAWQWECFSAARPVRLARVDGKMNAAMYRGILDDNLLQSTLDLGRIIFQ